MKKMEKKVNLGIIGCGFHGEAGLNAIVDDVPEIEVTGVHDINFDKAIKVASDNRAAYARLDNLLNSGVDAVFIATPTATHFDVVERVCKKMPGMPILLAKPMAMTHGEASVIVGLAENNGNPLMVGMTTIYRPEWRIADMILASGEIGRVRLVREKIAIGLKDPRMLAEYVSASGGGHWRENGIHALHHATRILGPVMNVKSARINNKSLHEFRDDTASVGLLHIGGEYSEIILEWLPYSYFDVVCSVYGENGLMEVRCFGEVTVRTKNGEKVILPPEYATLRGLCRDNHDEYFKLAHLPGDVGMFKDFAAMVFGSKQSEVNTRSILNLHAVLDDALRIANWAD